MNPPYLHLLVNVIPVLGSLSGLLLLGYGLLKSSRKFDRLAYIVFAISSLGTIFTYSSGQVALKAIANSPGVSNEALTTHQYIAHGALAAMLILGLFSIYGLYYSRKGGTVSDTLNYVILGIAFVSFAITVSTALQGVEIRYHKPIDDPSSSQKDYIEKIDGDLNWIKNRVDWPYPILKPVSGPDPTPALNCNYYTNLSVATGTA